MNQLTKEQLLKIEKKQKNKKERIIDLIIVLMPIFACIVAILEYVLVKNRYQNDYEYRYLYLLIISIAIYILQVLESIFLYIAKKDDSLYIKYRNRAPWLVVIYLFLTIFDYLTLKTGILMYPFIPWVNDIINIAIEDYKNLGISALYSLRLLFIGYFVGSLTGIITGICCGYNSKVRYWISPIIKILGPIPTATWIPLIMIIATSFFICFIIPLFKVSPMTPTIIHNLMC